MPFSDATATASAASASFRRDVDPERERRRRRTARAHAVIAAIVTGATRSGTNGASPKFSITTASKPASASMASPATA